MQLGLVGLVSLSLLIWLYLLCLRGQFWRANVLLEQTSSTPLLLHSSTPICAIIPARNEADLLPFTLKSLLLQTDVQLERVILVDDHSSDGTADVARQVAASLDQSDSLQVISAEPLPAGWSGKLWALQQGIEAAEALQPDYLLLTDADIQHAPDNLRRLAMLAIERNLDMASVMVRLRCESFWEKLLIPAFVFFFAKLYPFQWVNDPTRQTAAAAGGCILIRSTALAQIGGLETIRQALIDDCALAAAVKGEKKDGSGRIWLGLSAQTISLRSYPSLKTIWEMVVRTAFTQLDYSLILLIGTVAGMLLVYIVPILVPILGIVSGVQSAIWLGSITWLIMTITYFPTIQFYRCNPLSAASLPLIALLYTFITVDSALRYWQGRGRAWKGRTYS